MNAVIPEFSSTHTDKASTVQDERDVIDPNEFHTSTGELMANGGWEFWRVTPAKDSGGSVKLAVTRPGARGAVDRRKVWTLVPNRMIFLANWYLTEDYWREDDSNVWEYENLDIDEARSAALEVSDVPSEEIARLTHPESGLQLDQIDRHPVDKVLGKRTASQLAGHR